MSGGPAMSGAPAMTGGAAMSRALAVEGTLPSLSGAVEWLNSSPLTSEGLKGKVVLIDFWTYILYQLPARDSLRACLG